ncbi:MAG: HPP family protein [Pseudomonadota bacterium]
MSFLNRFKSPGFSLPEKSTPQATPQQIALAWFGSLLILVMLFMLTRAFSFSFMLGSFAGTCAYIFGYPELPFSQPRNILGGHFISALISLILFSALGTQVWIVCIAISTSIALMMYTGTMHPPAATNPLIIVLTPTAWSILFSPILIGCLIIICAGYIYNNLANPKSYPKYW